MSDEEAMALALEALNQSQQILDEYMTECVAARQANMESIKALEIALSEREALAQSRSDVKQSDSVEQRSVSEHTGEPVTLLPDGSAFGLMSFPLPDDHWIYAPNEYRHGEYEPIDLPKPILTHASRDEVVAAVRYAVRGATMRGQETDFDPDALVQNAVYALCGPFTSAEPVQPAKQKQGEPVMRVRIERSKAGGLIGHVWWIDDSLVEGMHDLYTTPQQRKPLTNENPLLVFAKECVLGTYSETELADAAFRAIEAAHGIKE